VLGKNHIIFNFSSLFSTLLYLNYLGYNLLQLSFLIILIFLFSNFPDIDLSYKKGNVFKRFFKLVTYSLFVCFSIVIGKKDLVKHRGITHSLYGLIFFSVIVILLWFSFLLIIKEIGFISLYNLLFNPIYPLFIIIIYALHLLGDSVTVEGIYLFNKKVHGFIKTGKNDTLYVIIYSFIQVTISSYFYVANIILFSLVFSFTVLLVFLILSTKLLHLYK